MKQKTLIFILLAFFASVLQAATVSKENALQKAQRFVAARQAAARGGAVQTLNLQTVSDNSSYYIFNIGDDGGFVIVSGDDRAPEILGYSDTGSYDPTNVPDNMRAFLQGYADEIAHMPESLPVYSRGVGQKRAAVRASISPLLTTRWNQRAPYNNSTPEISGSHAVTGCVATAMAQVMNYHRYPVLQTESIPGYKPTGSNAGPEVSALSATTFTWNLMRNEYDAADASDAAAEVAKLMQYCGASVQMNYHANESSAYTSYVVRALVDYFDYDAGAKYVYRTSYDYSDWVTLLYSELYNDRPVLLGGQSTGGGHAFVCDGYDEDDFFHINWGWGGTSNGFFRLSNLSPETQGAGGSSTNDGYNIQLGAAIGVQPNTDTGALPSAEYELTVDNMLIMTDVVNNQAVTAENHVYTRANSNSNFISSTTNKSPGLTSKFWNYTGLERTFSYGWRIKKDDEIIQDVIVGENYAIPNNYASIPGRTFTFGAGVGDGTYQIVAICKESGSDIWSECLNSENSYIKAVVSGNTLTMTVVNIAYQLEVSNATLSGTWNVGQASTMSFNLTNNGNGDYHGDITLMLDASNKLTKFGGKTVDLKAGETKTVSITATPSSAGTYTMRIYDGYFTDGKAIVSISGITVSAGSTVSNISVEELTIDNSSNKTVYGNALSGSVTIRNNVNSAYLQGISIILGKTIDWTQTQQGWSYNYYKDFVKNVNDPIDPNGSKTIDFNFKGLEYGERYVLLVAYYSYNSENGTIKTTSLNQGVYTIANGFVTIDAEGNIMASSPSASVVVPDNAVAVDLRGQETITSVTPNANPNVVYLLDEDATAPAGVNSNIVKGSTAESVTLSDGSDFNTPISFTAGTISYSRLFTDGTNATNGHWTTLILPFDVDKVEVDGVEKDWFHSLYDTGKHFWLKKFVSDGTGTVTFDYADKIEANTPYIIAVPDDTFGSWSLVGKTLVFSGTDKSVTSEKAVASGDNYKFVGTTAASNSANVYTLNTTGTSFEYNSSSVSIAPFRAYFKDADLSTASTALRITSPSSQPTAIGQLPADIAMPVTTPDEVYTLDGRRISTSQMKKGVYIVGGKKIVK